MSREIKGPEDCIPFEAIWHTEEPSSEVKGAMEVTTHGAMVFTAQEFGMALALAMDAESEYTATFDLEWAGNANDLKDRKEKCTAWRELAERLRSENGR